MTEGALIVDELVRANVPLAVGPTFGQPSKIELKHKSWETPGILNRAGCHVSIITDSPVTEQKHLRFCAAMAVNSGMDPFEAFKAITIYPAEHIGVADRVGTLEVGKDADVVLTDAESALEALGELNGKHIREDLVDTIFSRFCVGK